MNDQQGHGWPNNGYVQAHVAAPMPESPRRRSIHGWIVGVVLLLIAVTSFALVTLIMQGKSSDASGSASTVAAAPGGDQSEGAATSPSPSASTSATFPPEAVETCMDGSGEVSNPDSDQVRMKGGAQTSCEFLRNTRAAVLEHRAAHPGEDTFSVSPWSPKDHGTNVDLSCSPAGGFTYCASANKARIWVRNS